MRLSHFLHKTLSNSNSAMIKKIICSIWLFSLFLGISSVKAAENSPNLNNAFGDVLKNIATVGGYQVNGDIKLESTLSTVIRGILSALGIIFLILIIYSGLMWMTAGGNETKAGKAQNIITQAIIGLIIVVAAYAISYFVTQIFGI